MTDPAAKLRGMSDQTTAPAPPRRWGPVRVVQAAVVVAMLVMWGYVVYLAFGPGRADSPDKLEDSSFAEAAEDRCHVTLDRIDALPRAETQAGDPQGRADTLDRANAHYRDLVADLRDLAPTTGKDGRIVDLWLDDWETHLTDREDFADRLRVDEEARLLVEAGPDGRQITLMIDDFAFVNHMPSCIAPRDA